MLCVCVYQSEVGTHQLNEKVSKNLTDDVFVCVYTHTQTYMHIHMYIMYV